MIGFLGSWLTAFLISFAVLLGQTDAQEPQQNPAGAAKPPPSLLTGQPNAQQPQAPGTPPAAATTPAAAPNENTPQLPQGAPAGQQAGQPAQPTLPSAEFVVMLVRGTLIALNDANLTGNYDVLHALAAPSFQHDVDTAKLGESFKPFRDQKIDVAAVAVLVPGFVKPPELDKDGLLRVAGAFPSRPLQLRFSVAYQFVDGHWLYAALAASAQAIQAEAKTPAPAEAKPPVAAKPAPGTKRERYVRIRPGPPPATTHW